MIHRSRRFVSRKRDKKVPFRVVALRLEEPTYEALAAYAERKRFSVAEAVRQLVEDAVKAEQLLIERKGEEPKDLDAMLVVLGLSWREGFRLRELGKGDPSAWAVAQFPEHQLEVAEEEIAVEK